MYGQNAKSLQRYQCQLYCLPWFWGIAAIDVVYSDGVELTNLSDLSDETPSGHLYNIHSARVGSDLNQLPNGGLDASERPHLLQTGPNAWCLVPD